VSSPADGIVSYDDAECNASYIDLPEDFEFVESAAFDEGFDSDKFYVPVQRNGCQTFIYSASLSSKAVSLVCGPITLKDDKWSEEEKVQLTAFGSELDSNGRMWLCIFNRNLVVSIDLKSKNPIVEQEIEVFAPNDICIDPRDPDILYAVVGKKRALFTDPSAGKVKMIRLSKDDEGNPLPPEITKISRGKNTLAGIEATGEGEVIVAQLFDVFRLTPPPKGAGSKRKPKFWKEQRFWHADDGNGKMWLADNVSPLGFDNKTFMIPAYNTCSSSIGSTLLKSRAVTATGNFATQVVSGLKNHESARDMLDNPEVDVGFSNNDSEDPLRFIKMSNFHEGQMPFVEHFEVHLKDAHARTEGIKEGRKFFFDTNVTGVLSVKDKLICINFQQPRLLLLDLDKFYTAEGQREIVEMTEGKSENLEAPEDKAEEVQEMKAGETPEAEATTAPATATSLMSGESIPETAPAAVEDTATRAVVDGAEEASKTDGGAMSTGSSQYVEASKTEAKDGTRLEIPKWQKVFCGVCLGN